MSGPAQVPQAIWRGDDTPPLVWGFGAIGASEIPAGAEFRLEITWRVLGPGPAFAGLAADGSITATSPDGGLAVDQPSGTVTWSYTVDQSAGIPLGAVARYALRCLAGGHTQVWVYGPLKVRGAA
ncbi:hypothetical protein [Methylobacterium sp. yr668]|uniref:hypothetical protein n=1 Tax=Methylobacterium sp. yr668 TaxID=1761801 RepID=UPI0008E96D9F|nr:hypothetical protein [Methylobacterium sp. yr668]SFT11883.1 hypothetical protein SAMN04487845_11744 [Methylobacterium sp. yr668]